MKDVFSHVLVPKHEKLSDKDKDALLSQYNMTFKEMPKIMISDVSIKDIGAVEGDIIKITRQLDGQDSIFYRGVIND